MSDIRPVRYHDGERWVAGLLKVGTKNIHVVCITDSGVRVMTEPKQAERYCTPLMRKDREYPVARMVSALKQVGRALGITEAAKAILAEAA